MRRRCGALPGSAGAECLAYLARQMAAQVRVVRATYEFSLARRDQGASAEAQRLLANGSLLVRQVAVDVLEGLEQAGVRSAAGVVAQVSVLRSSNLRLGALRCLAALSLPAHAFLPTRRQRVRLKALLLRLAFRALARAAHARAERAGRRGDAWEGVPALCGDLERLCEESLDVLRALPPAQPVGHAPPPSWRLARSRRGATGRSRMMTACRC
jgi:hypothetical protein